MKKFISLVLSVLIIFGLIPVYAVNEEAYMRTELCYQTKEEQAYVSGTVSAIINELNLKNKNTYTRITLVNEWISKNLQYDFAGYLSGVNENRTAYKGLFYGRTVCSGYSQLAMEFCRQLGINAEYVKCLYYGDDNKEAHGLLLVEVEVDNGETKWYYWDPTSGHELCGSEYLKLKRYEPLYKTEYYDISNLNISEKDYKDENEIVFDMTYKEAMLGKAFKDFVYKYGTDVNIGGMFYLDFFGHRFYIYEKLDGNCYTYSVYTSKFLNDFFFSIRCPAKVVW